MFQCRSDSPQVTRTLTSSITKLVYKLPHKLLKDFRLRVVRNQKLLEKSQDGNIDQCSVFRPEIKIQQKQSKCTLKQISKFSSPVQFYCISLPYSKYFVLDCSFFIRICIKIWLDWILQSNVNDKKSLIQEIKHSFYMLHIFQGLFILKNGSVVR